MQNYAILIDGGFAKRKLGSAVRPATAQDFAGLVQKLQATAPLEAMRLHRVYYYDSVPLETAHDKPLNGGRVEFGNNPIANRSRQLFEQLAKQPFTALRLGELAFEGWAISSKTLNTAPGASLEITADDLKPQISQKGVDMRIGMDIAALTLKKQVQAIVLVSGDSDFVPAMKFARREGANLFLVPLGQRVKPAMLEHSDLLLEI
jgi:uncharacterized LabA/DUF88 family protein